jgi:tetratricopeptide (TPR) repeat protein
VEVSETVEPESIRITTSRPGHPLLVKVSYHPRWKAVGALGPYLASPGFMLVVPFQREVRLVYAGRTWSDWLGLALFGAALGATVVASVRRRRVAVEPPREAPAGRGALALAALPLLLVAGLAALRLVPEPSRAADVERLYARASQAYAAERWEEAAEYARAAFGLSPSAEPRRAELLCLQGEALLRAGHAREAVQPFEEVVEGAPAAHRPQALYSGAVALEASGDATNAAAFRRRLREEYPRTPWALRLVTGRVTGR